MKIAFRCIGLTIMFCFAAASHAAAATYGGSATGATVTVTATGTTIRAATGSLSISGGMGEASLMVGDIPSSATGGVVTLAASALHSAAVGTGGNDRAEASMGAVGLTVSSNQITADFIMARSTASCGPTVSGSSQLANLVINGQSITVTGSANQTVTLPNGTAVINEQISTINGTAGELTVNALHVQTHDTITGQPLADVTLSQADAKIDCQGGSSSTGEFVTGGGWITSADAVNKATFGFVAGPDNQGGFRGHLVLKDHGTGQTIEGHVILSFTACNADSPSVSEFNGTDTHTSNFDVKADDNGEPGSSDTFQITGTDQNGMTYINAGTLLGGNVQAHGFSCP
jgi:hypothetical protein